MFCVDQSTEQEITNSAKAIFEMKAYFIRMSSHSLDEFNSSRYRKLVELLDLAIIYLSVFQNPVINL